MKLKSVKESQSRPPLQKKYDPCDGPEVMLELDIVDPLVRLTGLHIFWRLLKFFHDNCPQYR